MIDGPVYSFSCLQLNFIDDTDCFPGGISAVEPLKMNDLTMLSCSWQGGLVS